MWMKSNFFQFIFLISEGSVLWGSRNSSLCKKCTSWRKCNEQSFFADILLNSILKSNILNNPLWAYFDSFRTFSVLDAGGRPPQGLLEGNINSVGMFEEYLRISQERNDSRTIKGKYCLARSPLPLSILGRE